VCVGSSSGGTTSFLGMWTRRTHSGSFSLRVIEVFFSCISLLSLYIKPRRPPVKFGWCVCVCVCRKQKSTYVHYVSYESKLFTTYNFIFSFFVISTLIFYENTYIFYIQSFLSLSADNLLARYI